MTKADEVNEVDPYWRENPVTPAELLKIDPRHNMPFEVLRKHGAIDAAHAEALDENRTRDLEAQIVAEREHLRLHTAYSFSYINEHAQRNVMGRIHTEALAEYRAARIAAKRNAQRRGQV